MRSDILDERERTQPGRGGLLAATIGAPVSVLAWIVDGATRPGYDAWRHQISHLALGERGWLGAAGIALAGLAVLAGAAGLRRAPAVGPWAPRLLALAGAALLVAAAFPIDPGQGYPPAAAPVRSWHGTVHDLAGPAVFAGLTAAAAAATRRLRAAGRPGWSRVSAAVAVVVPVSWLLGAVLTGLDYAAIWPAPPSGLCERIALATGLLWVAALCGRARGDGSDQAA
ncbi:DUF998 domain-containing protein [Pseudonocardia asaccharolytica]|uniref:DUF998 domain-containing protein n=1 Tax=Pseudonocardia asaccharolytica DSM 44247 = NBRC 16224 TaxID=1123024 RepID=A0A511D629_9PSEU|nr:DUF998 domain-containing protein [Pseudonocardia asaccharolytica]GEL20240.1 hypothetical protein PA7_40770 [Pseudonocardia asaccharolytica DSM 44247 = NBRC 16224]